MLIGNFEIEEHDELNKAVSLIGLLLNLAILMVYGHYLYDFLPKGISLNYNLFMVNGFIYAAAIVAATILLSNNSLHVTGWKALPIFYLIYAAFYTIAFPARLLKYIELNRNVDFGEYLPLAIGFIFWPFTIWFIQPRVNKIVKYYQPQLEE